MSYSKKNRNLKKIWVSVLIITTFIAASAIGILWLRLNEATEEKNSQAAISTTIQKGKSINMIRALSSVMPGELADKTKFEIVAMQETLVPEEAVSSMDELIGMRIKSQLTAKQFVMKSDLIPSSAWYDDGDRLIEHVFQPGTIPASVTTGSIVDVKLFRQNAEDPVVVAKAIVIHMSENTLAFYLNLLEQEYLKEASAEGLLFLTQYIDVNQTASDITYTTNYINRTDSEVENEKNM